MGTVVNREGTVLDPRVRCPFLYTSSQLFYTAFSQLFTQPSPSCLEFFSQLFAQHYISSLHSVLPALYTEVSQHFTHSLPWNSLHPFLGLHTTLSQLSKLFTQPSLRSLRNLLSCVYIIFFRRFTQSSLSSLHCRLLALYTAFCQLFTLSSLSSLHYRLLALYTAFCQLFTLSSLSSLHDRLLALYTTFCLLFTLSSFSSLHFRLLALCTQPSVSSLHYLLSPVYTTFS